VVSQDVWRQLKQRRDFGFISIGERKLKGIAAPVWLFAVNEELATGTPTPVRLGTPQTPLPRMRRIVPIAAAYLAAAAVILLSVDQIVERFALGGWVVPTAVLLLLIGLLVMLVTAWFQSRPVWERSVAEQPPWALDMPDLIDSVSRRELPDLTWARALMGGVAAFALLFGAAGAFLMWQGRGVAEGFIATGPDVAVAVLALEPSGEADWVLQAFPTVLSGLLDGVEGIRAVDPQAVRARGRGQPGPDGMARLGAEVGARFVLGGSAAWERDRTSVALQLIDVPTGEIVADVRADGDPLRPELIVESAARAVLGAGVLPVDPGAVETEFSVVRYHGDKAKAKGVYRGFKPLTGDDIAEAVYFVVSLPEHVNVLNMVVLPTAQRNPYVLHRKEGREE